MKTATSLVLAAGLFLTGCQVFQKSVTWEKVTRLRPAGVLHAPNPSEAYAAQLHRTLQAEAVEHKVVTYHFRYTTGMREEAPVTRTAVLYKDHTNSRHPWWLMDERAGRPVWLPNAAVEKQLSFYLRDQAEVTGEDQFPVEAADKQIVAVSAPRQRFSTEARIAHAAGKRVPAALVSRPAFPGAERPRWDELFAKVNRTQFDPLSLLDRRKMDALRQTSAGAGSASEIRTF